MTDRPGSSFGIRACLLFGQSWSLAHFTRVLDIKVYTLNSDGGSWIHDIYRVILRLMVAVPSFVHGAAENL